MIGPGRRVLAALALRARIGDRCSRSCSSKTTRSTAICSARRGYKVLRRRWGRGHRHGAVVQTRSVPLGSAVRRWLEGGATVEDQVPKPWPSLSSGTPRTPGRAMWSAAPAATPRRSPKLIEDSARGNWENLGIMAAACGVTVTGLLLMKQMAPPSCPRCAPLGSPSPVSGHLRPASGRRARAALLGLGLGIAVIASYWLRVCLVHRTRRMGLPVLLPQRPGRGSWIELLRPRRLRRGVPTDLDTLRTESRIRERVSERHLPLSTPTIFLFMPLGYLDYASANILWLGFVLLTFVLCVYVFLTPYGMNGLVLARSPLAGPADDQPCLPLRADNVSAVWAAVIGACLWQDRLALELTATKRARVA